MTLTFREIQNDLEYIKAKIDDLDVEIHKIKQQCAPQEKKRKKVNKIKIPNSGIHIKAHMDDGTYEHIQVTDCNFNIDRYDYDDDRVAIYFDKTANMKVFWYVAWDLDHRNYHAQVYAGTEHIDYVK